MIHFGLLTLPVWWEDDWLSFQRIWCFLEGYPLLQKIIRSHDEDAY